MAVFFIKTFKNHKIKAYYLRIPNKKDNLAKDFY